MLKSPPLPLSTASAPPLAETAPAISKPVSKPVAKAAPPVNAQAALKKRLATLSRWLHIYLSMVSFVIVLFFAVTGLTLNHADWFAHQQRTAQFKGQVALPWVKPAAETLAEEAAAATVAKLEIVEFLRQQHGIKGALGDFRVDETQCAVSFKGPGYSADTFINRATGEYELTETRMGLVAVINDLHKGRDSGRAWSWVIDLSAGLMTVVSLTGLVLLLYIKRRRLSGLLSAVAGSVICYLIYHFFVP